MRGLPKFKAPTAVVVLAGLLASLEGRAQESPRPPALDARVSFKVEAGPLLGALEAVERQTGVAFSVLPELLPPELKIPALSHDGPLAGGLDKIAGPLKLRWRVGEFGGIVVLPMEVKTPSFDDWVAAQFADTAGVELLEVGERGQRLGLRNGDILVALNGERKTGLDGFWNSLQKEVKQDEEVAFTVRRGSETLQVKVAMTDKDRWLTRGMGITRYADSPRFGALHEKGGHRGEAWDPHVRRLGEELVKDNLTRRPEAILKAGQEAIKAGCRDPLLAWHLGSRVEEYGEDRWREIETCFDATTLRSSYGGSQVLNRLAVAERFALHGPPSVRDRVRRILECGWAAFPSSRQWAYGAALLRFAEGEFGGCARIMKAQVEGYRKEPAGADKRRVWIHLQALCALGKYEEALALSNEFLRDDPPLVLRDNLRRLPGMADLEKDRLEGPVGLSAWRLRTAYETVLQVAAGRPAPGRPVLQDMGGLRHSVSYYPQPLPDRLEILFSPRVVKVYAPGASYVMLSVGAASGKGPNDQVTRGDLFSGTNWMISHRPSATIDRYYKGSSLFDTIPPVGFSNDGGDTLRIFKTPEAATVRCNGLWLATDAPESLSKKGVLLVMFESVCASADLSIFVPAKRCYDNDAIRERIDRLIDPAAKIGAEDRAKLWYEAAALSSPQSLIRDYVGRFPDDLKKKAPPPVFSEDAPALAELTPAAAAERFAQRGPVRWTKADPEDKDAVWCARHDGVLESMSRVRYWTTPHRFIRDYVGHDTSVGEPIFEKEGIWFPTNHGLFYLDRRAGAFRRVPIGDLLHDLEIARVSAQGTLLVVETRRGGWSLDRKQGKWGVK